MKGIPTTELPAEAGSTLDVRPTPPKDLPHVTGKKALPKAKKKSMKKPTNPGLNMGRPPKPPDPKPRNQELARILKSRMKGDLPIMESETGRRMTRAQRRKEATTSGEKNGFLEMIDLLYSECDIEDDRFLVKSDISAKECKDGPEFEKPKKDEWSKWENEHLGAAYRMKVMLHKAAVAMNASLLLPGMQQLLQK